MLANDLTLDKADGSDVIFRLVSSDSSGSRRIDIGSSLALPSTLVIRHTVSGKAPGLVTDRHLIQVNKTVAASVGVATVNANFTLSVPRDVAITSAIIHDVVSHLVDFLTDLTTTGLATTANIDAVLRGES